MGFARHEEMIPTLRAEWPKDGKRLVMESVADLSVNLPRIVVVEAAKGKTVVQQNATVGDVQ